MPRKSKRAPERASRVPVDVATGMPAMPPAANDDVLIPLPKARKMAGGVSPVTMWRWRHDPDLGFPPTTEINGRHYVWTQPFLAWLGSRSRQPQAAA
jgi:hypothetical protein